MLAEQRLQCIAIKPVLVGNHLDDARQVCEEVALVPVRQHGGHAGVVELDVGVVDLDKVDGGEAGDEGNEGAFYLCGDGALVVVSIRRLLFDWG